ncbi:MAG: hypothetical protein ABIB46_05285 [bacterium]
MQKDKLKIHCKKKTEISPGIIEIREYFNYNETLVGPDFIRKGENGIYYWSDAAADDIDQEAIGKEGLYYKLNANTGEIWNVIGFAIENQIAIDVMAKMENRNASITVNGKNYNNCLYIQFAGFISGSATRINWAEYLAPDIGLIKRETFLDGKKTSLIELQGDPVSILITTSWAQIKQMFK